ncbi:GNAT family N-acetyltransferase [candidate division WOR-3 bacterium]|nr:GNAT family N-acetyltransferase [candidate division WOR-3 bacterium]
MKRESRILIRNYGKKDLERLIFIVHTTIKKAYTGVYPDEAIEYFLNLHSKENIEKDIPNGCTFMLELDGKIIASGSIVESEIKRVFVLPRYQGKGYGRKIMARIEKAALRNGIRRVELCASLPSKDFYLALGYEIVRFTYLPVNNNKKLEYYDMEKYLGEN